MNASSASVEAFSNADPSKVWTVRELAEWIGIGGLGPLFVGGPQTVADLLEEWVEETDVDGFNLAYAVTHETFSDIVTYLVPELQRRGVYKRDYAPGTLREKLFSGSAPAAQSCRPPERWERVEVPGLRIVDDELWLSVKTRRAAMRLAIGKALPRHTLGGGNRNCLNEAHRRRFLLSGLLRCGCCHGPYAIIGRDRYACSTRKQKGTCYNRLTITRQAIEARVLDRLKERLLAPDLVAAFVKAFREETKRLREALRAEQAQRERKAAELDRKIAAIFRAIEDGLYEPAMKTSPCRTQRGA